jgi:hypothetical protein
MGRFSLKRLMCSVTLFAVASGIISFDFRYMKEELTKGPLRLAIPLWFLAGSIVAVAICLPITKRPLLLLLAAVMGLAAQGCIGVALWGH